MYEIYCDGSCRNNGTKKAVGAAAFIIYEITKDYKQELYREVTTVENATNNIAEMIAMINALSYWSALPKDTVIVHSDSSYIVNAYKQHWIENWKRNGWITSSKKPVKNKDLWLVLDNFFSDRQNVILDKVDGHKGIEGNEIVNKMAQDATLKELNNGKYNYSVL